jgi:hypothetical protein
MAFSCCCRKMLDSVVVLADENAHKMIKRIDSFSNRVQFEWPLYLYRFYELTKHCTVEKAHGILREFYQGEHYDQLVNRIVGSFVYDEDTRKFMVFDSRGDYDFAWHENRYSYPDLVEYLESDLPNGILVYSIPYPTVAELSSKWFIATGTAVYKCAPPEDGVVQICKFRYRGGKEESYDTKYFSCQA